MSDILSQDQIDALLNQHDDGDGAGDDSGGGGKDYPSLQSFVELFNEQGTLVMSTVLNREVSFTITDSEAIDGEKLKENLHQSLLMCTIPFETGFDGAMYLLISTADTARLADLMLMGEGTAEYTEDHKDALSELLSQIFGSLTTELGQKFGETFSTEAIDVQEFDIANPPFALENADMVIQGMTIAELSESKVAFIFPEALSDQIMQRFSEHDGGAELGDVGLNAAELDDLSKVTDFGDDSDGGSFTETSLSGEPIPSSGQRENIDMLLDVDLDVSIELGRADLSIKRILELAPGSIIELDRMAGEPVDLLVNNKVVAKGEVVVVDESFGIRIVSLVTPEERIKSLK